MAGVAADFDSVPQEIFVAAGRLVNAVLYCATVAVVAWLGRRCVASGARGELLGLFAGGLLAISPLGMRISGQFRNDAALLLLATAALLAAVRLGHRGPTRALVAGCLAGLAAGVKYTGVFAILPVLAAAMLVPSGGGRRRWVGAALLGFAAALLLSNPLPLARLPQLRQPTPRRGCDDGRGALVGDLESSAVRGMTRSCGSGA